MTGKYIVLDMETLYSKEYSLRKMTPPEYILDPRYSFIGCAVIDTVVGIEGFMELEPFRQYLRDLRQRQKSGEKLTVISHNALFDMCLLAWRFGIIPDLYVDTMSMARALVFHEVGYVSLDKVSRHLGLDRELGAKTGAIRKVEGMTAADIKAAGIWEEFAEYGMRDAQLCQGIFERLKPDFPRQEFLVNDMVIRAATVPRFKLDTNVLHEHLHLTRESKQALLERTGLPDRDALMSNDRFAEALQRLGVTPGTKVSLTTGKETYAFAKTDQFMIDLEEHENPEVQALAAARMGFKSTLEETRTERFINISQVDWGLLGKEWMPVPLRYSGAHTHRLSGDWKINCMHPDVELLTPAGWQRVEDWQPETPIAQWWPDGRIEWVSGDKVERYDTELVWFDAPFVKGGFTKDHRFVSLYEGRTVERTAGWIAERPHGIRKLPVAGMLEQAGDSDMTPDRVRLLVALAADGSRRRRSGPRFYSGGKCVSRPTLDEWGGWQFGFHKQRKADRLRYLLTSCGITFNERCNGRRQDFQIAAGECPEWFRGKGFGPWLLRLSTEAMDAFLDELVLWDGFSNSRSSQPTFCTTSREQALWVQTIAHLRGRPCSVKGYRSGAVWNAYFRQGVLSSVGRGQTKIEPYSGTVYCPQVPSTYVLARYGEGVFVTGNCQNLGRSSPLRRALVAPEGHQVVAGDLSQIEARLVAWMAGQDDLVEAFREGRDVYSEFAGEEVYGRTITKADKKERFVGKTSILGLGFGMGGPKFTSTVNVQSYWQLGEALGMEEHEGTQIVQAYRRRYNTVPAAWRALDQLIGSALARGTPAEFGACQIERERVIGPTGLRLYYKDIEQVQGDFGTQWRFTFGRKPKFLFGGKFFENLVQHCARCIIFDAALTLRKRYPRIPLALQVHDELVYVVPDALVDEFREAMEEALTQRVPWAPDLPVACEIGIGPNYGEAK